MLQQMRGELEREPATLTLQQRLMSFRAGPGSGLCDPLAPVKLQCHSIRCDLDAPWHDGGAAGPNLGSTVTLCARLQCPGCGAGPSRSSYRCRVSLLKSRTEREIRDKQENHSIQEVLPTVTNLEP